MFAPSIVKLGMSLCVSIRIADRVIFLTSESIFFGFRGAAVSIAQERSEAAGKSIRGKVQHRIRENDGRNGSAERSRESCARNEPFAADHCSDSRNYSWNHFSGVGRLEST